MLARVIQHHDALGAEKIDCTQVHDQQAAGPTVELAVQDRAQPQLGGRVELTLTLTMTTPWSRWSSATATERRDRAGRPGVCGLGRSDNELPQTVSAPTTDRPERSPRHGHARLLQCGSVRRHGSVLSGGRSHLRSAVRAKGQAHLGRSAAGLWQLHHCASQAQARRSTARTSRCRVLVEIGSATALGSYDLAPVHSLVPTAVMAVVRDRR
jgi:hypothetical protein